MSLPKKIRRVRPIAAKVEGRLRRERDAGFAPRAARAQRRGFRSSSAALLNSPTTVYALAPETISVPAPVLVTAPARAS